MSATKDFIDRKFKQEIKSCRELRILRKKCGYHHHVFVGEVSENGCDLYHYKFSITAYLKCKAPAKISKVRLDFGDEEVSSEILSIFNIEGGDKVEFVKRSDYPKSKNAEEDCIIRAESRLDEEMYSLTCNNCESYVNWIFANDNSSQQAESCIKNNLICNAIDGITSRGVIRPLHYILSGIIQASKTVNNGFEYLEDIMPSWYDLSKIIKYVPHFFIDTCKAISNKVQSRLPEMSKEISINKAKENVETLATDLKDSIIQFINALTEAAKKLNRDSFLNIISSSKRIVKEVCKAMEKKSDKKTKDERSPTAVKFDVIFEIAFSFKMILNIYNNEWMTEQQKVANLGRELFSSLFGLVGKSIGQILITDPIKGSLVGGVIGNAAGGAFGGTLFSFIYNWFKNSSFEPDVKHLQLSSIIFFFFLEIDDSVKKMLSLI